MTHTRDCMLRERTPVDLDNPLAFDETIAHLLPCLEATPFHGLCPPDTCLQRSVGGDDATRLLVQCKSPASLPARSACRPYQSSPVFPLHRRREAKRDAQAWRVCTTAAPEGRWS